MSDFPCRIAAVLADPPALQCYVVCSESPMNTATSS